MGRPTEHDKQKEQFNRLGYEESLTNAVGMA